MGPKVAHIISMRCGDVDAVDVIFFYFCVISYIFYSWWLFWMCEILSLFSDWGPERKSMKKWLVPVYNLDRCKLWYLVLKLDAFTLIHTAWPLSLKTFYSCIRFLDPTFKINQAALQQRDNFGVIWFHRQINLHEGIFVQIKIFGQIKNGRGPWSEPRELPQWKRVSVEDIKHSSAH